VGSGRVGNGILSEAKDIIFFLIKNGFFVAIAPQNDSINSVVLSASEGSRRYSLRVDSLHLR
jgi:hypothetical protein